ncbi:hypothetical protein SB861_45510 [Paraburkholderia sp. SIMBA_049]
MKTWMLGAVLALGAFATATSGAHEHFHVNHEHIYPRYHPPTQQQQQQQQVPGNPSQSSPDSSAPPPS